MNRAEMIEVAGDAIFAVSHQRFMVNSFAEPVVDALLAKMGDDTAEFRVRRTAPDTSKGIVDKVRGGSLQDAMLSRFRAASTTGYTDDELEQAMERTHQSVSATRNTLMRKGYVVDSGQRRRTRSGNPAIVYVPTGKEVPQ